MRSFGIPMPVYFMVVLTDRRRLWMRYSAFGRSIYAIGGNAEAARAAGIAGRAATVQVFAIHGFFAGIATLLFATQLQVIQSTVPPNLELTIITASVVGGVTILGGTGTVIGSTLAAILFAAIGSSLIFINVSPYWLRAVHGRADPRHRARRHGAARRARLRSATAMTLRSRSSAPRDDPRARSSIVALFVLGQQSDQFFTVDNLLNQGRLMTEVGLVALPMTFVIITGGIDLSVGSILGPDRDPARRVLEECRPAAAARRSSLALARRHASRASSTA